ncbi:MAG: preprotein translocase subunit SecG [Bacteroidales bacterium]|nr:preprotein translocase subunit SecG [Bacteroidales bacterium]MBN2820592.1 preprotein translocase subunit SecG [Bacteroidales bacterium]
MYTLISVIILLVCLLLVLIVLVQNSKGGGLAANFQSSNSMMGVRKTADFLEKATWTLASALIILSVLASMSIPKGEAEQKSRIEEQVINNVGPISNDMIPGTPGQYPDDEEGDE